MENLKKNKMFIIIISVLIIIVAVLGIMMEEVIKWEVVTKMKKT